jgi:nicotinamide riboside kinase
MVQNIQTTMRVAFTGPECSGKTELSKWVSQHFSMTYIPEYARSYLEGINRPYAAEDLIQIAINQLASWNTEDYVADTEMLVILIWFEEKFGEAPQELIDLVGNMHFDHYFLCKPDIPWVYDPLRENPHDRDRLFEIYRRYLEVFGLPYTLIEGDFGKRARRVAKVIRGIL